MHGANLHLAGAKPIVECVSSGLFTLLQEVQVKPRHAVAVRALLKRHALPASWARFKARELYRASCFHYFSDAWDSFGINRQTKCSPEPTSC